MPSEADPATLSRLLDLQAEDGAVKRLTDKRVSLPEARELAEVGAALAELDSDREIAAKQRDELTRTQQRLEDEIAALSAKIDREDGRLMSGRVDGPRELAALRSEVEMLQRNRGRLEDDLLEVMVRLDQAAAAHESIRSERDRTGQRHAALSAAVGEITAGIDAEIAGHERTRADIAAGLPRDLLDLYERLRDAKGGVGAAALERDTCSGCHTRLPAKELERMRAEGGLQRCDNCRRILVVV